MYKPTNTELPAASNTGIIQWTKEWASYIFWPTGGRLTIWEVILRLFFYVFLFIGISFAGIVLYIKFRKWRKAYKIRRRLALELEEQRLAAIREMVCRRNNRAAKTGNSSDEELSSDDYPIQMQPLQVRETHTLPPPEDKTSVKCYPMYGCCWLNTLLCDCTRVDNGMPSSFTTSAPFKTQMTGSTNTLVDLISVYYNHAAANYERKEPERLQNNFRSYDRAHNKS